MTVITGDVRDIGMQPLSGALIATAVEFRTSGDYVVAPESRSWPIEAGQVSVDLLPGPTRITVQVGSHARESFDVIVPDEPVTLARLVEDAHPWTPAVVSAVAAHRQAAEEAAGRAEAAAEDVDSAIAGAADQVVAAVEADRVAAEQAAGAAAGSASAADASAGDASAAAGAATSSASDAAGSASAAAQSATDADGSASDAEGSAGAAASSASDAASSASAAASSAGDAAGSASAASGHAQDAAGSASAALGHAQGAESWATSFDVSATTSTGAPGTDAAVTVTGDGPAYALEFTVPRGDQGVQGPPGEVSQAALDSAVASLVDGAPEALNTLDELASALGGDPNFATTVSTAIGERAKIDGAPEEYDSLGKLVSALIAGDLGGSTDAGELSGALTDQVDLTHAVSDYALVDGWDGQGSPPMSGEAVPVSWLLGVAVQAGGQVDYLGQIITGRLAQLIDLDYGTIVHTHTKEDVDGLQAALDETTDASRLEGALTDQVDATQAMVTGDVGGNPATLPLSQVVTTTYGIAFSVPEEVDTYPDRIAGLESGKADIGHSHTPAEVGLDQVDNTADVDKPVSTAQQQALDDKADQADVDDRLGGASFRRVTELPPNPDPDTWYVVVPE